MTRWGMFWQLVDGSTLRLSVTDEQIEVTHTSATDPNESHACRMTPHQLLYNLQERGLL